MDIKERLERDFFIFQVMVGNCPRCGSSNTHDCEAPHFAPNSNPPLTDLESTGSVNEIIKLGSECGVAREIDDNTIGHCDDCDFLWCLECGSQLTVDKLVKFPLCGHWVVCGKCSEENHYLDGDEIREILCPKCEHWDDGCQNEGDCIYNVQCPYGGRVSECPTIIKWINVRINEISRMEGSSCLG